MFIILVPSRVARFSWDNMTNRVTNKPTDHKITKGRQMIPNGHKICIPTFPYPGPSKIYTNWDFWYENIPPGNPGLIPGSYGRVFVTLVTAVESVFSLHDESKFEASQ
jgi:hypothetical protein